MPDPAEQGSLGLLARLKRRGVLRVAASYALIAWLVLQIGDVVLDPFDFGEAAMKVLLIVVALGFPVALVLAWFLELTPTGVVVDHEAPGAPRPTVTGIRRYADVVIIGVLVLIVAFLLARQGGLIEQTTGEQVVAVLPFANMSAEAEDAYFGEGLADTMIHRLGQLSELVVLASQSTFQFRGRDLDLKVVGAKLGATAIMTGSVQRAGNALRINARLVEVDSGKQLWSGSYDRTLQDVFAIQDEIADSAVNALQLVLAPEAQQRLHTPTTTNLTAYDAYVLGISRLARRTGENHLQALEFFSQAVEADPDYALAYTGLVEAHYLMAGWPKEHGWANSRESAVRAADRAVALNPELGEAWLAKALVAVADRIHEAGAPLPDDQILALFEKAIELSPSNAMAHKYMSNSYGYLGAASESNSARRLELLEKAARLDPRSGIIKVNIGETYLRGGDFEQSAAWFQRAANSTEPYFAVGIVTMVMMHLGRTGRLDEAARWAGTWFEAYPEERRAYGVAMPALLDLGARAEAEKVHERFQPALNDGTPYNMSRYLQLMGSIVLNRAMGDRVGAGEDARSMLREFHGSSGSMPVVEGLGMESWWMTALALAAIEAGRPQEALDRFLAGYPGGFEKMDRENLDVWEPPVVTAALLKQVGQAEQARQLLTDYLAYVRALRQGYWMIAQGWTPFTILAMLGETEAALDELEAMVDAGYLHNWWALREGAFDPDYAAVMADPRFERLLGRITARVDELRASYLAEPGLPPGYLQKP